MTGPPTPFAAPEVLVAGVGNVFLGDDGFGPAVVARLTAGPQRLPASARVVDYGIRGVHLGYDLLDGWETLVVVDALPGGDAPGTLRLLEVTAADLASAPAADPHSLDPFAVLSSVPAMGGELPRRMVVLGCTPASVEEGMGLSAPVAAAVGPAADRLRELLAGTSTATAGS